MPLSEDLWAEIRSIWSTSNYSQRAGYVVPEAESIKLGNDAVTLDGVVLYADLAGSTNMVNTFNPWFAANVYKSYLASTCRIIRMNGGAITAFDGDRVMAVYIGAGKESAAVRSGLQVSWMVHNILNAVIREKQFDTPMVVRQVVGIDVSSLFVVKTGIRGSNDLVWVGRAANYAAKLSNHNIPGVDTLITEDVYKALDQHTTIGGDQMNMWTFRNDLSYGVRILGSDYGIPC